MRRLERELLPIHRSLEACSERNLLQTRTTRHHRLKGATCPIPKPPREAARQGTGTVAAAAMELVEQIRSMNGTFRRETRQACAAAKLAPVAFYVRRIVAETRQRHILDFVCKGLAGHRGNGTVDEAAVELVKQIGSTDGTFRGETWQACAAATGFVAVASHSWRIVVKTR